ncbi:MAG TPA: hypothetical protein P5149_13845 [Candidatus Competibacteraceae bacterium]|nr:hypothetical protein [Candidatus Competibacteraceae bacterium]MCP5134369.1 hypothetical protein [Gammaproteobacteria bacterium]HPF60397.1 hypothetical protein [Candidatus Competibacteraceae bacterium]HRY19469.1 hypothetical protein [Candidatus Competibacteraceae bacterium]
MMSTLFSSMTIDGTDLELLALDALGASRKTVNPFLDLAVDQRQHQALVAKAARTKQHYEKEVLALLRTINYTRTGQAVFAAIRRQSPAFTIVIKPFIIDSYLQKLIEDLKARLKESPGLLEDHYKSLIRKYQEEALADSPNATAGPDGRGNEPQRRGREGRRENSLVRFTPAQWTYNPINPVLGIGIPFFGPGSDPDEVLLHELVHALRFTAGLSKKDHRVPFQKQYDNKEEFFAILITNIYRSECGRRNRRSGHDAYFWGKSADTEAFLDEGVNRLHVRQLRRQQPLLFNDLNNVNAPFNPLRNFRDARG